MHNNHKILYLALIICIFSFAIPNSALADKMPDNPQLEEIEKNQEKKSGNMHTKRWNTPKPKDKEGDKKQADKKDSEIDKEKSEKEKPEEELTKDQKIWKKYKELADKNKNNDDDEIANGESNEDSATADDIEPTDVNAEGVEEESEKQSTGMAAILERYKNSRKNKGNMTTRSLGSID